MSTVEKPDFEAPPELCKFMRGNAECSCICSVKHLPRNAILIRPKKKDVPVKKMYNWLVKAWRQGRFRYISMGTCQQQIRKGEIKSDMIARQMHKYYTISCVDNVDNHILREGDILLSRIGSEKSIGKPHLIKSSILWED